jgi:WD40 repeat protein
MRTITIYFAAALACWLADSARAQDSPPAPRQADTDTMPILRLEPGGPGSFVSALAFNPRGDTLYAAGWDKIVRAWTWNAETKQFLLDPAATYRVPIGPALEGVINAIAVSPDGVWLAAAGRGLVRGASDLRHPGWRVPTAGVMTAAMREDQGAISLFNTRTHAVRTLRGHTAPVVTLAFAPAAPGKPPILISAGQEWDDAARRFAGSVRAWDAARAAYLGGIMLPDVEARPALSAWHTGAGEKQLLTAIAWGDRSESLRIWNLETGAVRSAGDGQFNTTAAWWADGARLITGSTSRLKFWTAAGGAPAVARALPLRRLEIPRAIGLFASAVGGRADRAAIVVKRDGDPTVRLRILDLNGLRFLDQAELALWDGTGITPSLASAVGTGRLAIAGNANHEIATIEGPELPGGRGVPRFLRGTGYWPRSISFVRKGKTLGILVSQRPKAGLGAPLTSAAEDDLVLDPSSRQVMAAPSDWRIVRPNPGQWRVDATKAAGGNPPGSTLLVVREGERIVKQIPLPPGRQLTDFALLPPMPPRASPTLAVASHEIGQPFLELYDAANGSLVRELSAHVATIESLAFSDDGKLLASCAGDRTTCVWSVADLDQVVGARGTLPGVGLAPKAAALVVTDLAADSPYRQTLAVGDELIGYAGQEKTEAIASPVEFYLRVSRVKPGHSIALARRRAPQPSDTIQLVVAQGADERKPLFTLFITRDQPANWIGWSPLGPYDSNGAAVERLLGWHFNTGLPATPARYATADQYQHLRREGLIEQLMDSGNLPQAAPRRLDRPSMTVRLRQPGQESLTATPRGALRVLGPAANLDLEIRGLMPEQIERVTWRVGDNLPRPMEAVSRQVWSASLAEQRVERREWDVRIDVTTSEPEPQTFAERVVLVYQPPPPSIEQVQPKPEQTVTRAAKLPLSAVATSRENPKAAVQVKIVHLAGEREVSSRELTGEGEVKIDQAVELEPGDNTITLTATDDPNSREQTVVVRRLTFQPDPTLPPQFRIDAVAPDGVAHRMLSDRSEPLVVHVPSLELTGAIACTKPLERAEFSVADKHDSFQGFGRGTAARLNVKQSIALVPGRQRVVCSAQAAGGPASEVSLTVEYCPLVGELFLTSPSTGTDLIEGRDSRRVKLAGRIEPPADPQPFKAVVLLNGRPLEVAPQIDAAGSTFSAEVELDNGENRIEVELSNAWGAKATSEAVRMRYLRPPRVVEITAPATTDKPLADVSFVVESPSELKITGLRINDAELPLDAAVVERDLPESARLKVTARDVPLREGVNEIRPLARNADGWCELTKTAQVAVMVSPPPKAEIEFVSPAADRTAESSKLEVQFVVRSPSRLKRVELRGGAAGTTAIDVAAQQETHAAVGGRDIVTFKLNASEAIELEPRDNRLRAVAINDGGESQAELTVTYVRKPVEVVIDRLESTVAGEPELVPQLLEGGQLQLKGTAPRGQLWLHGRVRWPDAATQRLNQVSIVQVWINGFLQQPVALKAPRTASLEWTWKAKVRLNRVGQNDVSVRLPDVARTADCRLDFQVACSKPDERQRLHLLVVGVGEKNAAQLEAAALRAVRGRRTMGDQINTPAFDKGWIYLISGFVNRGRVNAQLERIHLRVGDPIDAGADVVMVYYRGHESLEDGGQFYLLTSQSQFDPDLRTSAVSGRDLSERFSSVPGAQLFLLDVQRQMQTADRGAPPAAVPWPSEPQMAALRYAWLGTDDAPADARLLVAFDKAVPQAGQLGEIEAAVSRDSTRVRQKYGPSFRYEPRVPAALRYLVLAKISGTN